MSHGNADPSSAVPPSRPTPVELPRCTACGDPIGSNALCESCQAVAAFVGARLIAELLEQACRDHSGEDAAAPGERR